MPHPLPPVKIANEFFATSQASTGPSTKKAKEQPWRKFYCFVDLDEGAPLVVACPKSRDFGSGGLGGVW